MKRILPIAIALCLALSVGLSAEAEVPADVYTVDTTRAEEMALMLQALGLFQGTDRGFELDRIMLRSEAATMLVRLLGREAEALEQDLPSPFTDLPDWVKPYVGWLYENKLTNGTSDTTFSPGNEITHEQYALFLSRALGEELNNDFRFEFAQDGSRYHEMRAYMRSIKLLRSEAVILSVQALTLPRYSDMIETQAEYMVRQGVFTEEELIQTAAEYVGLGEARAMFAPDPLLYAGTGKPVPTGLAFRYGQLYTRDGEDVKTVVYDLNETSWHSVNALYQTGLCVYLIANGDDYNVETGDYTVDRMLLEYNKANGVCRTVRQLDEPYITQWAHSEDAVFFSDDSLWRIDSATGDVSLIGSTRGYSTAPQGMLAVEDGVVMAASREMPGYEGAELVHVALDGTVTPLPIQPRNMDGCRINGWDGETLDITLVEGQPSMGGRFSGYAFTYLIGPSGITVTGCTQYASGDEWAYGILEQEDCWMTAQELAQLAETRQAELDSGRMTILAE